MPMHSASSADVAHTIEVPTAIHFPISFLMTNPMIGLVGDVKEISMLSLWEFGGGRIQLG